MDFRFDIDLKRKCTSSVTHASVGFYPLSKLTYKKYGKLKENN